MGRKKQVITVQFDKKIYKKRAIQKAIKSYSDFVKIDLREENNFYFVEFVNTPDEYKNLIGGEFSNYVLAIMRG